MKRFYKVGTVPKKEQFESKQDQKTPKQPFYCHWRNGEWDGKFRDKDGNIVE